MSHVIVGGMGRSGASAIAQTLAAGKQNQMRFEQIGMGVSKTLGVFPYGPLPEDLDPHALVRLRRLGVERASHDGVLIDKEPRLCFRYGTLLRAWPTVRVVYVVRNPLDLACSVVRGWGRRKDGRARWEGTMRSAGLELEGSTDHELAVDWWRQAVEADLSVLLQEPRARVLRYEDVLRERALLHEVARWLGVGRIPPEALARLTDDPHEQVCGLSARLHDADGRVCRMCRWREELEARNAARCWARAGVVAERLGYGPLSHWR